jgi:hypothetical protein
MDLGKVTRNDWIIVAGAVLMFIGTLGTWYSVSMKKVLGMDINLGVDTGVNGWHGSYLGWLTFLLCLAAAVVVLSKATDKFSLPVSLPGGLLAMAAGAVSAVIVVLRMLAQPGPNEYVSLGWGIWLSLIAAIVVALGGMLKNAESAS